MPGPAWLEAGSNRRILSLFRRALYHLSYPAVYRCLPTPFRPYALTPPVSKPKPWEQGNGVPNAEGAGLEPARV